PFSQSKGDRPGTGNLHYSRITIGYRTQRIQSVVIQYDTASFIKHDLQTSKNLLMMFGMACTRNTSKNNTIPPIRYIGIQPLLDSPKFFSNPFWGRPNQIARSCRCMPQDGAFFI